MIVNSVSTAPATTSTATSGSAEQLKNEFLKLLVTQIKNQDPLKPMDNAEFTSQLAQLSSLEQLQALNESMTQDLVYTQSLNNTMMLGMVGRTAVVEGDQVVVTDGEASASHLQAANAGVATVTVRDEAGAVVATFTQTVPAGWSELNWNGLGTDGQAAPDGDYELSVEVTDSEGATVDSLVYMSGLVESIRFENNLALLHIAGRDYYASEIARVGVEPPVDPGKEDHMLRSLYSGITGLTANSIALDVIGNNIANANTVGYKSSRVTFREMLTQTVSPSQRPVSGSRGGINAQQIGLGSSVGSIDSRFTQGHLETTGLVNDLALQGDGFFVLSDGAGRYYTRSGAFGLDADSNFVDPNSGMHLQGLMADSNGVIRAGAYENLYLDPGRTVPAQSTAEVRLFGNLNSNAEAQGSILESSHFMAAAAGTDLLTALYAQGGGAMNLRANDQISLTGLVSSAGGSNILSLPAFEVGTDGTTLDDLAAWIQSSLESLPELAVGEVAVSIAADGAVSLSNTSSGATLQNLQLTIPGSIEFNQSFRFDPSIGPGESGTTYDSVRNTGQIRAAATVDDALTAVYNSRGQSLGLNVSATNPSTTILIGGSVGEHQAPSNTLAVDAATTVGDLLTGLQIALGVSTTPVSLDAEGRIVMNGEVGSDNALGQVDIREVGEVNPTLETSFGFTATQVADDGSEFTASATVYDSLGDVHNVLFTFTKVIGRNEWNWVAEMEGDEVMVSGNTGTASFAETGEITAFRYTDDAGSLTFRPQAEGTTSALPISLQIDAGQFGGLSGLTQYAAEATLQTIADGHTVGRLLDYEINADGVITGRFSNDTVQTLAQIGVARFSNTQGLLRTEGNTFQVSGNSGLAFDGFAGGDTDTFITSGALEGSNVDLTQELTNMVIAQRAFQANAKVITTGDQMLQDIVSMIR